VARIKIMMDVIMSFDYTTLPNQSDVYGSKAWLKDAAHFPNYEKVFSELKPRRLLEIGAYLGYSLVAAFRGHPDIRWIEYVDDETTS
jgi:hypothetical protein